MLEPSLQGDRTFGIRVIESSLQGDWTHCDTEARDETSKFLKWPVTAHHSQRPSLCLFNALGLAFQRFLESGEFPTVFAEDRISRCSGILILLIGEVCKNKFIIWTQICQLCLTSERFIVSLQFENSCLKSPIKKNYKFRRFIQLRKHPDIFVNANKRNIHFFIFKPTFRNSLCSCLSEILIKVFISNRSVSFTLSFFLSFQYKIIRILSRRRE